jgi:spermidine/putrescine transport system substrate-binding protein
MTRDRSTATSYLDQALGQDISPAFADLWDPTFAGHVGMLTEMVDTMNLTLLSLGVDIQNATIEDATRAQAKTSSASTRRRRPSRPTATI